MEDKENRAQVNCLPSDSIATLNYKLKRHKNFLPCLIICSFVSDEIFLLYRDALFCQIARINLNYVIFLISELIYWTNVCSFFTIFLTQSTYTLFSIALR